MTERERERETGKEEMIKRKNDTNREGKEEIQREMQTHETFSD